MNRNSEGNYILEDKDGNTISSDTLQTYTLESNQKNNTGYELIVNIVIPINFKGLFYIIDGTDSNINTNVSNDFIYIGQNNTLTIEPTSITYERITTDINGSLPEYYHLYEVKLSNLYENYIIGTKI